MKRFFIILIYFFFTGFIFAQSLHAKYTVIPENPRPGEPVTIAIASGAKQAILVSGGRRIAAAPFFAVPAENGKPGFLAALLAIPSTLTPGDAFIRLENDGVLLLDIPVNITSREFPSETIELDPVLTGIRTDPSPQRTQQADRLWGILNRTGREVFFTGKFILPVSSTRRTSHYGYRRIYKYSNGTSDTSIHAGVDFGVPTGTQVIACGPGRVVLASMRIVTGNSIVIEHLPGVYSLYYHLDKIDVNEGDMVNAGTLLGLSGATGLATGPHLHWEVRVNGEYTDPDVFISRSIIDKDFILSKIYDHIGLR
jgi:murein DD-endopeptidase MepM/ murein hydrolase activator NlpD